MIVYYTKYKVKQDFRKKELFDIAFKCIPGMKNVPRSFIDCKWNGKNELELREGRNILAYEIDEETALVAFRIAILDENDELWTSDIVLDEKNREIQLRLAREKNSVSADYNKRFRIPYLFKELIRAEIADNDYGIPTVDKPIIIDDTNLAIIADIINQGNTYMLPIIYVSHPFLKEDFEVDIDELAKDMAGSAHVLVEKSPDTSSKLKHMCDGKNAYNGAVDIFYSKDSIRLLFWKEMTSNQFRYRIARSVFNRMAMRNIDEDRSLSALKIRNKIKMIRDSSAETTKLMLEIEDLEEKRRQDLELFEYASTENNALEKRINELENYNHELENKNAALQNSLNNKSGISNNNIVLNYSEKEYYNDEIKRIVLECIKKFISQYGDEEKAHRDYHILSNIVLENSVSDLAMNIKKDMLDIFRRGKLSKADVKSLKGLGFEVQEGAHDKYVFHNDDRYIVTVSNTPSDYREGENLGHDAVKLIFGRF